jgi:hypothetical protein
LEACSFEGLNFIALEIGAYLDRPNLRDAWPILSLGVENNPFTPCPFDATFNVIWTEKELCGHIDVSPSAMPYTGVGGCRSWLSTSHNLLHAFLFCHCPLSPTTLCGILGQSGNMPLFDINISFLHCFDMANLAIIWRR